jgi:phage tail sheath protein FI
MPDYPGVRIEEINPGPRPIEGVPTSTAAFLGETERGPLRPRLVTSYAEYQRWFGAVFLSDRYLPHAARGFFENGGKRLYVSRIAGQPASPASRVVGDFTARAAGPGSWGRRIWLRVLPGTKQDADRNPVGFRLQLAYWSELPQTLFDPFENPTIRPRPQHLEDFDDLSVDPESPDYFEKRLIDEHTDETRSALVTFGVTTTGGSPTLPAPTPGDLLDTDGTDAPTPPGSADFVEGLRALESDTFREVALVYAPFPPNEPNEIARALVSHCEQHRFRFAVIDAAPSDPSTLDPRNTVDDVGDTSYAAVYAPWLVAADDAGHNIPLPPGGHVLGIYARTDVERGVFKAPANEVVRGALDLTFAIDDGDSAALSTRGVNAIRQFPSRGIRVWGARTLSSDALWKYVTVRRLFSFLQESIREGTRWVVFEPNDERLWGRVKDTVRLFLRTQWRAGALFGRTEEDAFFVTCDRTTMTQDDILNGRLICEIGVAAVKPAEFVIFRIFQHTVEAA